MQMNEISVSIVLDKRRAKNSGKYPVKLRVYCPRPRKQVLYNTHFDFTESEFHSIWETKKPRSEFKELRFQLNQLEVSAKTTIGGLKRFSFDAFEKAFFNQQEDYSNAFEVYDDLIRQKSEIGAVSTAEKYALSKRCMQNYLQHTGKKSDKLYFEQIDTRFLEGFKHYCENTRGLSPATIGIYLRNLRTVVLKAISMGVATRENYPFGRDSFQIPTSGKINKSLTDSELSQLWHFEAKNEKQQMAKDFWFFSYYSYGMNTKDICELRHDSISGKSIHYVRAKTKTTKKERKIKEVPINNPMQNIIERRKDIKSKYLFGVLNDTDSPKQKHEKIRRFNKLINLNFRAFALDAGINSDLANQLGTYHARHSFATIQIRKGISTALISEILHDGNLKVTENYINSFPKEDFLSLSQSMEL